MKWWMRNLVDELFGGCGNLDEKVDAEFGGCVIWGMWNLVDTEFGGCGIWSNLTWMKCWMRNLVAS